LHINEKCKQATRGENKLGEGGGKTVKTGLKVLSDKPVYTGYLCFAEFGIDF